MDLLGKIINYKYKIEEKLFESEFSSIYSAINRIENNRKVVIKLVKPEKITYRKADIARFRSELITVSRIDHPNILKIFDVGETDNMHYLVMEAIEGASLANLMEQAVNLPIDRKVAIICQICEALVAVHDLDMVHRQINPGNIMIRDQVNFNEIKLINFGFSQIKDFNKISEIGNVIETFSYMSPEQSGIIRKTVDKRSDLYSLGILFYQLLSGQLPFKGNDISTIIHQHIAMLPESLTDLNPALPPVLEKIVYKLIEKDPERRYKNTRRLIDDLKKYLSGETNIILDEEERTIKLRTATVLIGREKEYERLINILDRALNGNGCFCLISGEFGIGKSRLIEELISNIYYHRGTFLEGNRYVGKNMIPYGAVRNALNDYMTHFNEYSPAIREMITKKIRSDIGNMGEMIVRFNPMLSEIIGQYPHMIELKPDRETTRFLITMSQLFYSLSIVEKGIVLIFDNIHQLDESSFIFLQEIVKKIGSHPLLIIGTYRDNELPETHSLSRIIKYVKENGFPIEEIRLEPFDFFRMNKYISSLLYASEEETGGFSDFILKYSRGNPYFASELLKQLKEESAITTQGDNYSISKNIIEKMDISPSVIDIILKRLTLLNEKEKTILSYAAVIGVNFDIEYLFKLTKYPDEDVIEAIDRAVVMQIIKTDQSSGGLFLFSHDRIRDTLYRYINAEKRKMIHLTIANIIEGIAGMEKERDIFALMHHYIESGNKEKILEYAYPAANKAMENHANREAIRYLRLEQQILEDNGKTGGNSWVDCMEKLGEINLKIGNCDESISIFEALLRYVNIASQKAVLFQKISQAHFIKGDWNACELFSRRGLLLLGEHIPLNKALVILSLIKEIALHYAQELISPHPTRSRNADDIGRDRLIINYYMTLDWMYILSDIIKFIRSVVRMLNLSQSRIGPSKETSMSLAVYGSLLMVIPNFNGAVKFHETALRMRKEMDDQFGIAQSLQFMGYCYCYQGDYNLSLNYFNQSIDIFRRIGDVWELAMCFNGAGYDYFYISDYDSMIRSFREYLDISEKINDHYGISAATANLSLAYAQKGDYNVSETYGKESLALSDKMKMWYPNCFANINYGYLMMEKGNYEEALHYFQTAQELYEKNNFLRDYTVYLYPLLAESYLEIYKIGKTHLTKKMIKKACFQSIRKTRKWHNHYASALRVTGKYYAMAGRTKKAVEYFKKSIRHSAIIGRRYEVALGLYEYGLFLKQAGKDEPADVRLTTAIQIFKEIGAIAYIKRIENILGISQDTNSSSIKSLIDKQRMFSIIRVSQDISSILDLNELLEKVMSVSIEVTGAQRGVLMIANYSTGELEIVARKNVNPAGTVEKDEILLEITVEVFRTGKSKLITNAMDDERYARLPSVIKYGLKSILCIPLKQKDEIIGVCYLDNPLSESVFTEDVQDVLSIIMTQAAISIEIVRLYELGITDGLTKLATHRHFQDMLHKELSKAIRYSRELSLIMIDIDHFKEFNDRYGHQAGDEVLKVVSRIIKGNCRDIDIAARYGGEELALILPETPHGEAEIVAERIRHTVEENTIEYQHKKLSVSISIGVASYPLHAHDRQSLIKSADDALYISKERGRNRVTVSDNSLITDMTH